mgnify:CR=1 FL=1
MTKAKMFALYSKGYFSYFYPNSNGYGSIRDLIGFSHYEAIVFSSRKEAQKFKDYCLAELKKIKIDDLNRENILKAKKRIENAKIKIHNEH